MMCLESGTPEICLDFAKFYSQTLGCNILLLLLNLAIGYCFEFSKNVGGDGFKSFNNNCWTSTKWNNFCLTMDLSLYLSEVPLEQMLGARMAWLSALYLTVLSII